MSFYIIFNMIVKEYTEAVERCGTVSGCKGVSCGCDPHSRFFLIYVNYKAFEFHYLTSNMLNLGGTQFSVF